MNTRNTKLTLCVIVAVFFTILFLLAGRADLQSLAGPESNAVNIQHLEIGLTFLQSLLALDILIALIFCIIYWNTTNLQNSHNERMQRKDDKSVSRFDIWFAGVLLVALILRLINLNSGMWIDEYLTVQNYIRPDLSVIATRFLDDNQHWLFSVLAKCSTLLFTEQPWAVRFPALVFGILSIWSTYRLGKLVFNNQTALLACIVLTFSYHHIWYSQNARGYTILLFATVVSVELLLRAIQDNRWLHWLLYAIALALAVGGHLTGIFIGIAHFLILAAHRIKHGLSTRQIIKPLVAFLLAAIITLHMFAALIPQMADFFLNASATAAPINLQWKSPLWTISELIGGIGVPQPFIWPAIAIVLFTGLVSLVVFYRHNSLFLFSAMLPAMLLVVVMILMGRNLWPRLLFNMAGFIALYMAFVAVSVSGILARVRDRRFASFRYIPQLMLLVIFLSTTLLVYKGPKQDFNSAKSYVESHKAPEDTVVGLHIAGTILRDYYNTDWPQISTLQDLQQLVTQGDTWVVYTLPSYIKNARPEIYAELQTNYQKEARFSGTLGDGDILILRKNKNDQ